MKTFTSFRATTRNPALKLLSRLFAVFGMLMMFAVSGWGDTENNDVCSQVELISEMHNQSGIYSRTEPGTVQNGDDDYYYFTIPQSGTLTVNYTSTDDTDLRIAAGVGCSSNINRVLNSGTSYSGTLSITAGQTVYVRIVRRGGTPNYSLGLSFSPPSANLALTNTDSPDPVVINQSLVYTLGVSNGGPNTATSLILTDTLPTGVVYQSATGTGWSCSQAAGVVTCTNPTLANGANSGVAITVTAPATAGTITNTATVTSAATDPTLANNTATATTTVQLPQVGWEQATYETAENTALAYGGVSQMPMRIVLDTAVDYPISVTYQTYNGTAIGDADYRIAGGTVTIPAGQTSVTVNMDIYHDEAIELAENFTVVLSNPTGSGGVSLRTDRTTAPVTITEQNTAPMCYSDNFDTTLDDKWRTLVALGGFTPQISSGHLKLTPGKKSISTAVTKDYEFPSRENLIIVEFQHYAYGGCFEEDTPEAGLGDYGADGVVAVLYDSAVGATPTVGGYGGSMGYAQRTDNVANGFQGGWLGLGLDEYGNFANPTEGRVGGPGFHTNAAVIRGDGNGTTGYEFLAEAYPLTTPIAPLVDFTNPPKLPGDKFRLTVDARSTANLYIRLERDTGAGYVTIINGFDAKNPIYNQTTTPDLVRFALTAGTGGGCNAHEIDELTVWGRCTPYNPTPGTPPANTGAVDVVDNYPLNGYTTRKGLATKITSKPGNTLDAVWLGTAGGGTAVPYYTAGNNNVVDMPVLFYVSDINSSDDNGTCTTQRYQLMGANGSPLVATFSAGDTYKRTTSTFTVQNSAKKYSKIVPKYINFYGMNLLDPTITCLINSSNSGNIVGLPQCVNSETQYRSAFGQAAVDRCRNDVTKGQPCEPNNHGVGAGEYNHNYGCYQCTIDALATQGCSSDAFAIRPDKFVVTSTNAAMPNLLRAGQEYNNTINAYNYNTTTNTLDYNVTSAINVFNLVTTKYNRNDVVTASMAGTATFPISDLNMSNGLSTKSGVGGTEVAGLLFGDVGKVNFSLQDRIWSAVDNDDIPSDLNCSGVYICGDKNVTFIPDHFDFNELNITNNNGNPGSFTYIANEFTQMGGRIHTQMRALNKNGAVTQNFAASPLWENNINVVPVVQKSTYRYPDANETTVANLVVGFGSGTDANGTKTIAWNETNTSQYLRFNFRRDVNQTEIPFDVNGSDLNISMTSLYTDPSDGDTATIYGDRNATGSGSSKFIYGRIIPRDVRVFGQVPFTANAWYEVFGTNSIGATVLPASKNDASWYTNTLHNDVSDGDANVTAVVTTTSTTLPVSSVSNATGIESYLFNPQTPPYGAKAHIDTDPWLWYGETVSAYLDPSGVNLNCMTHPCFNINVVPAVGATGSAITGSEANKGSKKSTNSAGAGGWKSTSDYAPAVR